MPGWVLVLVACCLVIIVSAPWWVAIAGHDGLYHRNWIGQFTEQFREGTWYPRWMGDSFSGFGSPVFYFYPPFAYHAAGVVSLLGISDPDALYHAIGLIFMVLSFFTCRAYLRTITLNRIAITAGAFMYANVPYRILNLYVRNAWSEYVALTWLPLIFLVAERLLAADTKREWIRYTIIMGGLIALTIVTNIPATIVIVPGVVVYMLCIAPVGKYTKLLLSAVGSSILGVLFAGVFTFPLFALRTEMHQESLWQFFQSSYVGYSLVTALSPNNRVFGLSIIAVIVFALWASLIFSRAKRRVPDQVSRRRITAFIVLLVGPVFLQIPAITEWLYYLPPFRYIQFAFRWDILICIAIAAGAALIFNGRRKQLQLLLVALVVTSALLVVAVRLRFGAGAPVDHARSLEHDDPAEYLSIHAKRSPMLLEHYYNHRSALPFQVVSGFDEHAPEVVVHEKSPDRYAYEVMATDTGTIAINLSHFSTWEARRSEGVISSGADEYGRRLIPIEKGQYKVEVVRTTTRAETYGAYASIAGVALVLFAMLGLKKKA